MTTFNRLQEYLMLTVGSSEAEAILQLAVQLVEEEREACAKLAETLKTMQVSLPTGPNGEHEIEHVTKHGVEIAAAIRCRR